MTGGPANTPDQVPLVAATGTDTGTGTGSGVPDPDGSAVTDELTPWRRLAIGMLLVEPLRELIRFIPLLIVLIFAGRAGNSGPPWGLIGTAAVIAATASRQ